MWRRRGRAPSRARSLFLIAGILLAVVGCQTLRPDRALRTATGMAAHDLCSETFVAGLDPEQTFDESIAPRPGIRTLAWALRRDVDHAKRQVRTSFFGVIPSRAIYRDGYGCVLVHGNELVDNPAPIRVDGSLPDDAGQRIAEPASPMLKAALDAAFAEPAEAPHRWTKAVVIVHDGEIVAERYAPGYGIDTPILGFSMSKSVMNALVGILVYRGKLHVDQPAPIAAWKGADDPRRAITLENLMRMDSGLALDETGSGFDPSNQMLYDEPDMAGYAERAAIVAAPRTRWFYSSASTHLVSRIVRDAVGGTGESVQNFARRELFAPLGMRHVTMEMDATGTPIGGHYVFASARDWARFGGLYVNDGVVNGRRLLPEGWSQWSSEPTSGTAYGAGWWTNRGSDEAAVHRRDIGIPADAFFAVGNLGQRIAVIPSERLVIVRMARAHTRHGDMAGFERLIVDTIASLHPPG